MSFMLADAAVNSAFPKGFCPGTRNTTSSVIRSRTVARSPALLADIQVATNVRIACSSSLIARIEQNDCKSATGHSRPKRSKPYDPVCPLCPRKRTLSDATAMSALCQKPTYAVQQKAPLFDHVVGAHQQHRRHVKAERLRPEADDALELRRHTATSQAISSSPVTSRPIVVI